MLYGELLWRLTRTINSGSGIFISPGGVLANSGSVGAGLIVWVVSGLIAFLGTLDYLELVKSHSGSGLGRGLALLGLLAAFSEVR